MELNDLIDMVDIVDYISQFVELTQKGDEFWGLSCFKYERTPSFSVSRNPPFFHDFSSGLGGNVFNFVKLYFKCTNKEAIDRLKEFAGYDGEVEEPAEKMTATTVFQKFKPPIIKTKTRREVLDERCMEKYIMDPDKLEVWEREGISREVLKRFQVRFDPYSNRIVYPIRNIKGEIVNIGGRTLCTDWKERQLRKYTYFYKWEVLDVIYGLYEHRQAILDAGEIILFEGCKSVLLAETWGVKNTGAILTSHLNESQMKILAKLAQSVTFALDKDVNIKDDKRIWQLKNYVPVYYIFDKYNKLDDKDSPADHGEEVFKGLHERKIKLR